MSAPDTNLETQRRRHLPSLLGTKGALTLIAALVVIMGIVVFSSSDEPAVGGSLVEEEAVAPATAATD